MLELNNSFFVLMGLFLFLLWTLNLILFQPLLKVWKEREEAISGAAREAERMAQDRDARINALKAELTKGSQEAKQAYETLREEGASRQRELLEAAQKEAHAMIDKARAELRDQSEKARQRLKADAEQYAGEIVNKLLKV